MGQSLARRWAAAPVALRLAAAAMVLLALTLLHQDVVGPASGDAEGQGALAVALVLVVPVVLFVGLAAWLLGGSRVAWCIAAVLGLSGLVVQLHRGTEFAAGSDALTTALSGAMVVPLLSPSSVRRVWVRRTGPPPAGA